MEDLMKIDLYELLQIEVTADEKEIRKAYRKKALTCHPDKNPDNPKAAELFQQLSKAFAILIDKAARAAYDKVFNARKAAKVRHAELDSKRKKFKEDLEAREKAVQDDKLAAENYQKEIERIRQKNCDMLAEENERLRQQIKRERLGRHTNEENNVLPRLKIKWKTSKRDETNGGYNKDILETLFRKYGNVICVVSTKKKGSALVEFTTHEAAQLAYVAERGYANNPLSLSWISGQPELPHNSCFTNPTNLKSPAPEPGKDSVLTSRDYESLGLMKLRQAEERKKLIQQMAEADYDDN